MKSAVRKVSLLLVSMFVIISVASAQAGHTLNFRIGGVVGGNISSSVTATIIQPYHAVLSTASNKTASMDALFVVNNEAIVNIQFQAAHSEKYMVRITIGDSFGKDITFTGSGSYNGALPLNISEDKTDILLTVYKL